jgi:hypothetical protein
MAIARAKGKLKGKRPKLSDKQQKEFLRIYGTGKYSIGYLGELFSVSRPTVDRTLARIVSDWLDDEELFQVVNWYPGTRSCTRVTRPLPRLVSDSRARHSRVYGSTTLRMCSTRPRRTPHLF